MDKCGLTLDWKYSRYYICACDSRAGLIRPADRSLPNPALTR